MSDRRRALGAAGEDAVATWYEVAGYEVLDRNWRCRDGELDLVLAGPGVVVFCEVKTRRSDTFGTPAEAVTREKQLRIRRLAIQWLKERNARARSLRFDVASVRKHPGQAPVIEVLEAAF